MKLSGIEGRDDLNGQSGVIIDCIPGRLFFVYVFIYIHNFNCIRQRPYRVELDDVVLFELPAERPRVAPRDGRRESHCAARAVPAGTTVQNAGMALCYHLCFVLRRLVRKSILVRMKS